MRDPSDIFDRLRAAADTDPFPEVKTRISWLESTSVRRCRTERVRTKSRARRIRDVLQFGPNHAPERAQRLHPARLPLERSVWRLGKRAAVHNSRRIERIHFAVRSCLISRR